MPKTLFPDASPQTRARLEQDPILKLFNEFDWASNPLGPIPQWPESLKGAVRTMMVSTTPMAMLVGEDGILLYNSRYADFSGSRHPEIFGVPAVEAWPEVAEFNRENVARGLRGEGISFMAQRLMLNRNGTPEPVWLDLHYSPMLNEAGMPMGSICVVIDVSSQHRVAEALADSEVKFRTLADTMPQMVWSTLPDGFHDYYNARWYEFTGVPDGSTDGEGWNGMFHADDQERAWATWRHSLATGEPYQIEYRLRHHSGEYRWTLGRALPIRDDNDQIVRWIGTCTDIHESRLVAEERELVAQELSHRIKNIFAVLTGIIGLSARSTPEAKPFADRLRQRIHALGEAHDFVRPHSHLSAAPHGQGKISALIERLMRAYEEDEDNRRVTFSGDDTDIDDAAATPLALLFHELATNAAKYGALSLPGGRVSVEGRDEGESFSMTWRETGGAPVVMDAQPSGFGTRLIHLSVEGQMRGTLNHDWRKEGLVVEIVVPKDALNRSLRLRATAMD